MGVVRCRSQTKTIAELDRELEQQTARTAPELLELSGCGAQAEDRLEGGASLADDHGRAQRRHRDV